MSFTKKINTVEFKACIPPDPCPFYDKNYYRKNKNHRKNSHYTQFTLCFQFKINNTYMTYLKGTDYKCNLGN